MTDINLDFYRSEYREELLKFELPEEQAQFTALPADKLEEAWIAPDQYPIVIADGHNSVGFFILHSSDRVKDYTNNPKALLLTALSIDHSRQGRGYAKRAMGQLAGFIRESLPGFDEIVLAVNKRNVAAQKLYEKTGFRDTGERRMGKIGEQFIYSCPI